MLWLRTSAASMRLARRRGAGRRVTTSAEGCATRLGRSLLLGLDLELELELEAEDADLRRASTPIRTVEPVMSSTSTTISSAIRIRSPTL
jgi:hypothetical protein